MQIKHAVSERNNQINGGKAKDATAVSFFVLFSVNHRAKIVAHINQGDST